MKKIFLLLAAILSLQCAMAQNVAFFVKGGIGMSDWIGQDWMSPLKESGDSAQDWACPA